MSSPQFPTRLADLTLNDSTHNPSLYASLRSIRKSALSIPNRLSSILDDTRFAKEVSRHYGFPLVANERCGSWYIDPADKVGSAYFKSTDGHHGQWAFSSRRLNLPLLPVLAAHGGAVIVDSTRRGKNLPDAFSKTVPIWVTVINRALFPEASDMHYLQSPPPPDELGMSEISQIEARLDEFTEAFRNLGLDLESLRMELGRPISISWAINGFFSTGQHYQDPKAVERHGSLSSSGPTFRHIVLCSASRRVRGAEISEGGYIQGAGDDSEGWSHGLTAQIFWQYRELLMQCPEEELPALIKALVEQDHSLSSITEVTKVIPTSNINIAGGLPETLEEFDLILSCQGDEKGSTSRLVSLNCRSGKLGSKDLRDKLPRTVEAASKQLAKDPKSQILVTCSTGKDIGIGVALAILCLFYNDQGQLREPSSNVVFDKQLVKQRLAWITCSKADANPSRATLQAVNSFLMQRP
ncbi:tRNA A64-2'-O-ribosylphosphate transferase [Cladophialophora chaetospira]|uniref:tRNA A64-2'-O-ribosylphosphate transferase n=1 Tax=Cladophialophora chaetospira TaxID=386627 RepID=A0AA39CLB0_9EURO|nr:tRNA A64-2'-O-ribosylphosphate transferase [Cladophialophora chaetospira]